jgi:nucleotide-binding universal stress UspA family protein
MWRPIVVGVENTGEAARAAVLAEEIAKHAGTVCYPVHATRDVWSVVRAAARHAVEPARSALADLSDLPQTAVQLGRRELRHLLEGRVQPGTLERLRVEIGRPVEVLGRVAADVDAELLVLGHKPHTSAGRWLGACAAERLMRAAPIPILIASPHGRGFHHVLVAVDFSDTARTTIGWAEQMVELFGSAMRVMHVVELLPEDAATSVGMSQAHFHELSTEIMEESVKPLVTVTGAEFVTRQGHLVDVVNQEVEDWGADLLVIGTHGKSLTGSFMLGSAAERFLQKPPTSMMIVPDSVQRKATPVLTTAVHGQAD